MKLITFLYDNTEAVGVLTEDGAAVRPLPFADMNALIQAPKDVLLTAVKDAAAALPLSAVTLLAPIPRPRQDVICLGINYMAHSDEAEKYSADAFATQHQDAIYFSKRVTRAVPDGGFIEGQRMAVFDECFGTGGLSGVDGNRLFIRLGEVVDRFEALVGNVDGIISRIEFDADAGIPF